MKSEIGQRWIFRNESSYGIVEIIDSSNKDFSKGRIIIPCSTLGKVGNICHCHIYLSTWSLLKNQNQEQSIE